MNIGTNRHSTKIGKKNIYPCEESGACNQETPSLAALRQTSENRPIKIKPEENCHDHENPAAPDKGSPVFTIPGWDVIDRCREAGFAHAEMILMASTAKGILGSSPPFINILRAYR